MGNEIKMKQLQLPIEEQIEILKSWGRTDKQIENILECRKEILELEMEIQEEIDNADDTIVKSWYAKGKGIFWVQLPRKNNAEALRRGFHTKYFTGTKKEYLEWSNDLSNKSHDEFKLIDCGEVKSNHTLNK